MSPPVIIRGVTIPDTRQGKGLRAAGTGKNQLFIKTLQVGDMFEVLSWKELAKYQTPAKKLGLTLVSRKLDNGKIGVWRTA